MFTKEVVLSGLLSVVAVFVFTSAVPVTYEVQPKASARSGNYQCFSSVYDFDNCPEKETLHDCARCCSELQTYYQKPPSKNVCLAACSDKFPKLKIDWTYL